MNNHHVRAIKQLATALQDLSSTTQWLELSFKKCQQIGMKKHYSADEMEALEALAGRFARACDFLINKVYRAIDKVELEETGTIIDVLNKADKRGLVSSIEEIREIKGLRNIIAHEYAGPKLESIFESVFKHVPSLLDLIARAQTYCQKYL